jgi:hypothetical protein
MLIKIIEISHTNKSLRGAVRMKIKTRDKNFTIREAKEEDIDIILKFINELADYENLSDQVIATKEILQDNIFTKKSAEVIIGEYNDEPIGFALFFYNFTTFNLK